MGKEKVTLTLDADKVDALRELVGRRSLSAGVNDAVAAHIQHLRHLEAVDGWLDELEAVHGPIPGADVEWAERVVSQWEAVVGPASREAG